MKFHITPDGPKECKAEKRPCKYGEHYPDPVIAQSMFEKKNRSVKTLKKNVSTENQIISSDAFSQMVQNNKYGYPEEELRNLVEYLGTTKYKVLTVIPAGSFLFNSRLPGASVHDYDFTVIVDPGLKIPTQKMPGNLDATFISVNKLPEYISKSNSFAEAFYAYKNDEVLYKDASDNNSWGAFLNTLDFPLKKYFPLLSTYAYKLEKDLVESGKEKITVDDSEMRQFKHLTRFNLYLQRWGNNDSRFNPRLSDSEREKFVETIESGHFTRGLTLLD